MSAVSMKVTPISSARWIVAIDSASSVSPYHADIPMHPSPTAETSRPWPSIRVCMPGRYPPVAILRRPMAVPKRKTSKSRRDKRRATHAISAPRVNVCPQCGQPKRPHRLCPTCGTYRGREVEPLRIDAP